MIVKAEWANSSFVSNQKHMQLLQEFASLHCLCAESFQLIQDDRFPDLFKLTEKTENCALHWSRCFEWPWAFLHGDIELGHHCLDVGGGHSVFQYAAARHCSHYLNLDSNVASLNAVHRMRERLGLQSLHYLTGEIPGIQFSSNSFDRIFCISVLEHCDDWKTVYSEMMRILKPGGFLILTMDIKKAGDTRGLPLQEAKATFGVASPPANALSSRYLNCLCLKVTK